ncbi:pyridoxamine 5'-phosphate oxidase family protein [Mumia sp. DW29H23]|uniref:pyridoxamine 5'-phosphate oxidase family protein n=1 Tax=Mumia sp. DW29H23 TaxID=3421241 RepID=UPI003D6881AF
MTMLDTAVLSEAECWSLLDTQTVGRIAFVRDGHVELLPLNYRVSNGGIVIRTSLSSPLAALCDGVDEVAFEADYHDDLYQRGWSVVITGRGRTAEPDDVRPEDLRRLNAWAHGERPLLARIDPVSVTGRRVEIGAR